MERLFLTFRPSKANFSLHGLVAGVSGGYTFVYELRARTQTFSSFFRDALLFALATGRGPRDSVERSAEYFKVITCVIFSEGRNASGCDQKADI